MSTLPVHFHFQKRKQKSSAFYDCHSMINCVLPKARQPAECKYIKTVVQDPIPNFQIKLSIKRLLCNPQTKRKLHFMTSSVFSLCANANRSRKPMGAHQKRPTFVHPAEYNTIAGGDQRFVCINRSAQTWPVRLYNISTRFVFATQNQASSATCICICVLKFTDCLLVKLVFKFNSWRNHTSSCDRQQLCFKILPPFSASHFSFCD